MIMPIRGVIGGGARISRKEHDTGLCVKFENNRQTNLYSMPADWEFAKREYTVLVDKHANILGYRNDGYNVRTIMDDINSQQQYENVFGDAINNVVPLAMFREAVVTMMNADIESATYEGHGANNLQGALHICVGDDNTLANTLRLLNDKFVLGHRLIIEGENAGEADYENIIRELICPILVQEKDIMFERSAGIMGMAVVYDAIDKYRASRREVLVAELAYMMPHILIVNPNNAKEICPASEVYPQLAAALWQAADSKDIYYYIGRGSKLATISRQYLGGLNAKSMIANQAFTYAYAGLGAYGVYKWWGSFSGNLCFLNYIVFASCFLLGYCVSKRSADRVGACLRMFIIPHILASHWFILRVEPQDLLCMLYMALVCFVELEERRKSLSEIMMIVAIAFAPIYIMIGCCFFPIVASSALLCCVFFRQSHEWLYHIMDEMLCHITEVFQSSWLFAVLAAVISAGLYCFEQTNIYQLDRALQWVQSSANIGCIGMAAYNLMNGKASLDRFLWCGSGSNGAQFLNATGRLLPLCMHTAVMMIVFKDSASTRAGCWANRVAYCKSFAAAVGGSMVADMILQPIIKSDAVRFCVALLAIECLTKNDTLKLV